MAVVIVATAGSASANSFITLAEAQTYMDSRLNGDLWTAATTDTQNRALVEATRELCMLSWEGLQATTTQALQWPRWSAKDPDSPVGFLFDVAIVPTRVKNATAELAFQFVNAGTTDIASLDSTLGVIEKTVDVITTRWQPYQKPQGLSRFPSVMRFIRPLLASMSGSVPILRG